MRRSPICPLLGLALALTLGCTDSSDGDSTSAGSSGGTGEGTSGSTSTGPDPDYQRECQPEDFICSDWGCSNPPNVAEGECYKRCTPTEIGGLDDECDEPERPYCSQVGQAFGGDYDCNGCAHICVAVPINQCNSGVDACE